LEQISVGDIHEEWKNGADGYIMEYSEECGFALHVFLNGVSPHEREQFTPEKPFEIRSVAIDRVMFFCLKFGSMDWADCAFSPNLYSEPPKFKEIEEGQGLALNILLIDSGAGQLLNIRTIGLGHEFSERFQAWCKSSLQSSLTHEEYMKKIDAVYAQFSTLDLVGMCHENDRYKL
jgi:hypothetical protein